MRSWQCMCLDSSVVNSVAWKQYLTTRFVTLHNHELGQPIQHCQLINHPWCTPEIDVFYTQNSSAWTLRPEAYQFCMAEEAADAARGPRCILGMGRSTSKAWRCPTFMKNPPSWSATMVTIQEQGPSNPKWFGRWTNLKKDDVLFIFGGAGVDHFRWSWLIIKRALLTRK